MSNYLHEQDVLTEKITTVTKCALYRWIIWQFPIVRDEFFYGAVLNMDTHNGWYPALIQQSGDTVKIFGNQGNLFQSAKSAMEWFNGLAKGGEQHVV